MFLACMVAGIFAVAYKWEVLVPIFCLSGGACFLFLRKSRLASSVFVAAFLVGVLVATAGVALAEPSLHGETAELCGTVCDDYETSGGRVSFTLRRCSVNGRQTFGRVKVYCEANLLSEALQCGDEVTVSGTLTGKFLFRDGVDAYAYRSRLRYEMKNASVLSFREGSPTLAERFRAGVKEGLFRRLERENASVVTALLLGDKSEMTEACKEAFTRGGILHLFAVSGLHVGFVTSFFFWILKRVRCNRWLSLGLVGAIAVFYAYLTGFSPSVVRAVWMAMVLYCGRMLGEPCDILSSVSFAALLLLCVRPFYLFDAGFSLSFAAVFSIGCFQKRFGYRVRNAKPTVQGVWNACGTTVAATLGTLPFLAHFFGEVSLVGTVTNLIAIPLSSVLFLGGWAVLAFGFLAPPIDLLLGGLRFLTQCAAQSPLSCLPLRSFGVGIVFFLLLLAVFGGYFLFPAKIKRLVSVLLAVAVVVCSLFAWFPSTPKEGVVLDESGFQILFSPQGVIVRCDFSSEKKTERLKDALQTYGVSSFFLIADGLSARTCHRLSDFSVAELIFFSPIVNRDDALRYASFAPLKEIEEETQSYTVCGWQMHRTGGNPFAVMLQNETFSVILAEQIDENLAEQIKAESGGCHLVWCTAGAQNLWELGIETPVFTREATKNSQIYDVNRIGNFTLCVKNGKIVYNL